jgi:hypothetical protein
MTASEPITFGDRVMILVTDEIRASGHAGWVGQCYGFTTPRATSVEVVGPEDQAPTLSIHFDGGGAEVWFVRRRAGRPTVPEQRPPLARRDWSGESTVTGIPRSSLPAGTSM